MVPVQFLPWLMWGVTTLFFAYQFIMRLAPGLVMQELMQKFGIDATAYGFFAALYYFAYAGMQIPVALLLDRLGPKAVIAGCGLLCSLGTLLLVYTDQWAFALFSRLLIGAGSAAGFLGASKVISVWFPEKMYTRMVGFTFTFGLLGAVYGGRPVGVLISQFGWETVLRSVGLVGLVLSVLIACLVKNPQTERSENKGSVFNNLKQVLGNKKLLLLAFANLLMVGSLEGFADVWGIPYLVLSHGFLKEQAAQIISFVFVGMLFGGPVLAYLADKLKSSYWVTSAAGLLMGVIFITLLSFNVNLTASALYALFFLTGILCCYQVLVFSIGVHLVSKELAGLTVAFLNCINMLGGSFFHSSIGQVMDLCWNGALENNIRVYDLSAYTTALSVIPLTALLGSFLVFWIGAKKKLSNKVILES